MFNYVALSFDVSCLLSFISNCQLSIVNYQLSIVNYNLELLSQYEVELAATA